jgi:hypothetical protein
MKGTKNRYQAQPIKLWGTTVAYQLKVNYVSVATVDNLSGKVQKQTKLRLNPTLIQRAISSVR